ncbi:hypothetical protein L210DRAFT_3653998 [Boletus edulis BED1]|uniref:Uncharacterized protein n=1 Tax=Boletus edulis BED1 TaxID=1328754 RepID=A0AAD4BDY3_BOLED|nr:hypothetical protein L210DRAFT_3653998 [Boletus edulis BED1]
MTVLRCDTTIPPHWALAFADSVAEFMVERFQQELLPPSQRSQNPKHLPQVNLETLCEAQLMRGNYIQIHTEALMLPANLTPWQELQEPALILDRSDNVLVWYLPSAVSQPNQMAIWQNMKMLQEPLGKTIPASLPSGINNWRTHPDLF